MSIIDIDPEFGLRLDDEARELVRRHGLVQSRVLPTGQLEHFDPRREEGAPVLGMLIVEGLIMREVELAGRSTAELLGQGDLLRPWDDDISLDPLPGTVLWSVLHRTRIAMLDRRFAAVAGRWPSMLETLVARGANRTRLLAMQRAIAQVPRIDARVLMLMWLLAERWGRVGPQGIQVPIALTHETIAKLVGARRPSVTTALGILARRGFVERCDVGWMLHGDLSETLPNIL